jgi:mono/diheme cytochrome c family protein
MAQNVGANGEASMSFHQPRSVRSIGRLGAGAVLLLGLASLWGSSIRPAAAQDDLELGKQVYEKANCVGCHKWHGDGGGGYGGAALSLRETSLDRDLLLEVIRCGRPATGMPYHDRNAYKEVDCYGGMTKADLGADFPPMAATFLRDEEVEAVAVYVASRLQGQGAPTKEDCIAFWGEGAKECESMR